MSLIDSAMVVLHQLFAALWVGGVVFVALAVLPLARDGTIDPDTLDTIVDRFVTLSRTSAFFLLVSGSHLIGNWYTGEVITDLSPLYTTGRGHLVLTMVTSWGVLAALVEISSSRLRDGLDRGKLREPARDALPWYRGAALVAVLVTLVAGLLSAGVTA